MCVTKLTKRLKLRISKQYNKRNVVTKNATRYKIYLLLEREKKRRERVNKFSEH